MTEINVRVFIGALALIVLIGCAVQGAAAEDYKFVATFGKLGNNDGQFSNPHSVAFDSTGNVFVADSANYRVQKFTSAGAFLTKWDTVWKIDDATYFECPMDIAFDSAGNAYVTTNSEVVKFDANGTVLTRWGKVSQGSGDGEFNEPCGIAVDGAGHVYVADKNNHRVQVFDTEGHFLAKWGTEGSGDGEFAAPSGIAVDGAGNVYVAEISNNRIQKFTSTGTFLKKWGSLGSGPGQLSRPEGVATDGSGNVYVAEADNNRIQKFDANGTFVTMWGSLGSGDDQFKYPHGVAVDAAGNVYVADTGNGRIQKFALVIPEPPVASFSANVTSGPAPLAVQFTDESTNAPTAWAWQFGDGATSSGRNPVHVYTSAGNYTVNLTATNGDGSNSTSRTVQVSAVLVQANFSWTPEHPVAGGPVQFTDTSSGSPEGWEWTFGDGTANSTQQNPVYAFAGPGNYTVRLSAYYPGSEIGRDVSRTVTVSAVSAPPAAAFSANVTSGPAPLAVQFTDSSTNGPTSWAWEFGDGSTSTEQHPVHVFASAGTYAVTLAPSNAGGTDSAKRPLFIVVDPASAYRFVASWDGIGTGDGIPKPHGIAVNSAGNVLVLETVYDSSGEGRGQNRVQVFNAGGEPLANWPVNDDSTGPFNEALGIDVDGAGNVYVADTWNHRVQKFAPDGTFLTTWGRYGSGNGEFNSPQGVAVDTPGNVYVTDLNHRVQKFDPNGTFIATWGSPGTGELQLWYPHGIAVSIGGDPYVAEESNHRVQMFDSDGEFWVMWGSEGSGDGEFRSPQGIAVDRATNVFVADTQNHRIQKFSIYGTFLTKWGSEGSGDGQFFHPTGVAVDALGNVYVTEPENHRVQKFAPVTPKMPFIAFSANVRNGTAPLTVRFTDESTNAPTNWAWEFGDGGTSTMQHPTHVYTSGGTYTVNLTVWNDEGDNSTSKVGYITVRALAPPVANFSANVTSGPVPLAVRFTDTSTNGPTSWAWEFGDGATSTEQNPVHVYGSAGAYTVVLKATNADGRSTVRRANYVTARLMSPPHASFHSNVSFGTAPTAIQFTDDSTNSPTAWAWEFGDGAISTEQNPTHIYSPAGTYTVNLTATNGDGSNTTSKAGYIRITSPSPPVAAFFTNVTRGTHPLAVRFTDMSTNGPTSWAWEFGDGATSSEQHPVHVYYAFDTLAVFPVNLTVTNGFGSSTTSQSVEIQPDPIPDDGTQLPPAIVWSRTFGGNGSGDRSDVAVSVDQMVGWPQPQDYIVAGWTESAQGGDVGLNHGARDAWVMRLDSDGQQVWNVTLGGSNNDWANAVQHTNDGGFIVAGGTQSSQTGDVGYNPGMHDAWIIKLDGAGQKVWNVTPGIGSEASAIRQAKDGGYIVATKGNGVVKLDATGQQVWRAAEEQLGFLQANDVRQTEDGGYVVAGDGSGVHGGRDLMVTKLDGTGQRIWGAALGGSQDDSAYAVQQTWDGGYIVVGDTASLPSGDVVFNHGQIDSWVVKLDAAGQKVWTTTLGTSLNDQGRAVQASPGIDGYIVAGSSESIQSESHDAWVQKLDLNGKPVWTTTVSPTGAAWIEAMLLANGGYVVAGSVFQGESHDLWVASLFTREPKPPVAAFSSNVTSGSAPLTVQFTDESTNSPTDWVWAFGDSAMSPEQNPVHVFKAPGTYTVTLAATSLDGTNTISRAGYITVTPPSPPIPGLSANITNGTAPLAVQFTDTSTNSPTAWAWEFGDGATSDDRNPTHVYTSGGSYTVNLTATNRYGSNSTSNAGYITVKLLAMPQAAFHPNASFATAPAAIQFTDDSTNGPTSWAWEFGDGATSTEQNPTHVYTSIGTFTVNLTVTNGDGSGTTARMITMTEPMPNPGPIPDYRFAGAWGSGGAGDGQFNTTDNLALDGAGNVYVVDSGNHRVQKFDADGAFLLAWGSEGTGDGQFLDPAGIAVARNGSVWVTDRETGRIQMFTPGGAFIARWEPALPDFWYLPTQPSDIAFDTNGDVYIVGQIGDSGQFHHYREDGSFPRGSRVWPCSALAVDRMGTTYYAIAVRTDLGYGSVGVYMTASDGTYLGSLGGYGTDEGQCTAPTGVAIDRAGTTWVVDAGQNRVHAFDANRTFVTRWGSGGAGDGQFSNPTDIEVDGSGNLYVADSGNHRVQKFAPVTPTPPVAAFSANVTAGPAPLAVQFTDASTNAPTSWAWEFGDGGTSDEQNPVHVYGLAGTYTVNLTATNGDGSGATTQTITVTTALLPVLTSALPPTDTNGDGKYDDVNGNGRKDFADIVLYFNQMSWIAGNEPPGFFDYNGNGRIDFADVVWLFNHL